MDIRAYILDKFPGKSFNARGKLHAHCPFHEDSSPSFSITEEGFFICGSRSCGVRGRFALFYKMVENIGSWQQVYDDLKITELPKNFDMGTVFSTSNEDAAEPSFNGFPSDGDWEHLGQLAYFTDRGFTPEEMIALYAAYSLVYGTGWRHEGIVIKDSIIAPIYDLDGKYRTFQVRYLDPDAPMRWRGPTGTPLQDMLYGGWLINNRTKYLWVVEGASDVWNLYRHGRQAVGVFTKEATVAQLQQLNSLVREHDLEVLVCLDGDTWSEELGGTYDYIARIHKELLAYGLKSHPIYLDRDLDPGVLSSEQLDALEQSVGGPNEIIGSGDYGGYDDPGYEA